MRKFSTNKLCILALCSVINLIGGQIALLLRLPIYLDSFGTVFAAAVMGPFYGMIPGIVSNLIGGVTTDIYALYYLPDVWPVLFSGKCRLMTEKIWEKSCLEPE
jgi:energy-coupling factor transport system substrate-specific component